MKNKIKIISLVFFLLFSLTFISALSFDWADFTYPIKQGDCFNVFTTCENCSYMNITILFPNGTSIIENEAMTNLSSHYYYNYSFCDTSVLGIYPVLYYYDSEYGSESSGDFFEITPSGKKVDTAESIIYLILTTIIVLLDLLIFYFIFTLPSKNEKNDNDKEFKIVKLKYIRIILIGIIYPMIIVTLNLVNGLAVNFTSLTIFAGVIGFLFMVLLKVAWLYTIIIVIWIIVRLIRDTNFKKLMTLGGYTSG